MMAFIGVRISWLMLARKSDLALVASSAASLAARTSASCCLRSVMSVKLTTEPTIVPSFMIGVAPYSTGRPVPSLRHRNSSSMRLALPRL